MKISLLLLLAFFIGCAGGERSTTKSERSTYTKKSTAAPKAYRDELDFYQTSGGQEDALIKESLARSEGSILRNFSGDDDANSAIASKCYQGNFKSAFSDADDAYSSYKMNPGYWNSLGTCYYLMKDYKKAILFYNRAKGINSSYAPAVNNLGVVFQAQGDNKTALYFYKNAVNLKSGSKTPRFNMANIYLKFGIFNKACGIFNSLYSAAPLDLDVINARANCYLFIRRYSNAVALYQKIPKDNLSDPSFGLNYSVALSLIGKGNEAKEVYKDIKVGNLKEYYRKVGDFLDRK